MPNRDEDNKKPQNADGLLPMLALVTLVRSIFHYRKAQEPLQLPQETKDPLNDLQAVAGMEVDTEQKNAAFLHILEKRYLSQNLSHENVLDLFLELKKQDGPYSFIHKGKKPGWDRFRLHFIPKSTRNPGEENFWHTEAYQQAVKLLKSRYSKLGPLPSTVNRTDDHEKLLNYVPGNSPVHRKSTETLSKFISKK